MADCDCVNFESFAAGLSQMRKIEGFEATVYLGLFKRMSETLNAETWQQVMVRWCLFCPCPAGQQCAPGSDCCWLPCLTEIYDTLMLANTPVVNFPGLPPFPGPNPPGDPLQWLMMIEPKSATRAGVRTGTDVAGM